MVTNPSLLRVDPPEAPAPADERGLGHVPALDGLRALAVAAVVTFHFARPVLPGGFLGVDVFFVLSGFLITALLVAEIDRRDRLDLGNFWARRARRLFPALGVMLVVVAVGTRGQLPLEQLTVFQQGLATLAYLNNWWLVAQGTGYFTQYEDPSPLLHTWSLAVEEQWYVIFPVLLLLGCGFLARRSRALPPILLVLACASAGWTAWLQAAGADLDRLYFGTDVRAQELLVGAALGALVVRRGRPAAGGRVAPVVGGLGAAGVAAIVALADERSLWLFHGGMLALAVGVAAVIWAAIAPGGVAGRALGWRPLAALGLISYGVYLWHWPIAVWLDLPAPGVAPGPVLLGIVATLAVSVVSYLAVEVPIRTRRWSWVSARAGWQALGIGAVSVMVILTLTTTARTEVPEVGRAPQSELASGYQGSGPRVLLVGDSLSGVLDQVFGQVPDPGFALSTTHYYGCGLTPDHIPIKGVDMNAEDRYPCPEWYASWGQSLAERAPDLALAMVSTGQFHHDVYAEDGTTVLTFGTAAHRRRVEAILDEVTTRLDPSARAVGLIDVTCNALMGRNAISAERNDLERTRWINAVVRDYVAAHPQVHLVELSDWDCGPDARTARTLSAERKFDGLHYSESGGVAAWEHMAPQIRAILAGVDASAAATSPPTG